MSVYVGPSLYPYGRMVMCHMVADQLWELLTMAESIGVARWFQAKPYPHYDVSKGKRALAIRLGAVETDERKILKVAKARAAAQEKE